MNTLERDVVVEMRDICVIEPDAGEHINTIIRRLVKHRPAKALFNGVWIAVLEGEYTGDMNKTIELVYSEYRDGYERIWKL